MSDIDRRAMLRYALATVAAAAAGTALSAGEALAAAVPVDAATGLALENPVEEAAVRTTCWWHRGRRVCRRRRVRRVCWWRRGRRVCAWR
jgi:hypothetical protein